MQCPCSFQGYMDAFNWPLHTTVTSIIYYLRTAFFFFTYSRFSTHFDAILLNRSSAPLLLCVMFASSSSLVSCLPSFICPASSSGDQWDLSPRLTFLYSSKRFTAVDKFVTVLKVKDAPYACQGWASLYPSFSKPNHELLRVTGKQKTVTPSSFSLQ